MAAPPVCLSQLPLHVRCRPESRYVEEALVIRGALWLLHLSASADCLCTYAADQKADTWRKHSLSEAHYGCSTCLPQPTTFARTLQTRKQIRGGSTAAQPA
jgi:hypothetical protein